MGTLSLRPSSLPKFLMETLILIPSPFRRNISSLSPPPPLSTSQLSMTSARGNQTIAVGSVEFSVTANVQPFPIAGAEEALMGFISGKRKATEVAHSVWKNIIQKGDTVIDATCGNGHDTLALLKMIADGSGRGCVYGMDIQKSALDNTSSLLVESVDKNERKLVKLFSLCHSKMEDIVAKDIPVRLVAFNLGYLPGGDNNYYKISHNINGTAGCK